MALSYLDFYDDLMASAKEKRIPVACTFELTARCNFQCKMCYICDMENHRSLRKRELTAEQWIRLGEQARDAGLLFLTLSGGEIFIRKDFWKIYEALTHMGLIITLFTNASLLDDKMIGRLAMLPPYKVSVSVYGASPTTYGNVTGHSEAYQKVVDNIRKMTDAGVKVHLKTTVVKYNSGEYGQLLDLAQSTGHNIDIVNYISPRREGTGTDPLANRLSPMELAKYEADADDAIKRVYSQQAGTAAPDVILDDVMADEHMQRLGKEEKKTASEKKSAFRCAAGKCASWLTWEGRMTPCGLMCDIASEPLDVGFERAWSDIIRKTEEVPVCDECEACANLSRCTQCPARLKLETGEFTKAAEYLCELVKARDVIQESRKYSERRKEERRN